MLLKLCGYLSVTHKESCGLRQLIDGIMEPLIAVLLNPFHPRSEGTEGSLVLQVENWHSTVWISSCPQPSMHSPYIAVFEQQNVPCTPFSCHLLLSLLGVCLFNWWATLQPHIATHVPGEFEKIVVFLLSSFLRLERYLSHFFMTASMPRLKNSPCSESPAMQPQFRLGGSPLPSEADLERAVLTEEAEALSPMCSASALLHSRAIS